MRRPLRITFNDRDYNFEIVNTEPITRSTLEIPIRIDDHKVTLLKTEGWRPRELSEEVDSGLLEAIGKAIALRYRL